MPADDHPTMPRATAQEGGGRCPICGKPREARFKPFCSARCRDRDLINWLDGRYAIPVEESEPGDDEEEEAGNGPR